jgi:hypothetical protein
LCSTPTHLQVLDIKVKRTCMQLGYWKSFADRINACSALVKTMLDSAGKRPCLIAASFASYL